MKSLNEKTLFLKDHIFMIMIKEVYSLNNSNLLPIDKNTFKVLTAFHGEDPLSDEQCSDFLATIIEFLAKINQLERKNIQLSKQPQLNLIKAKIAENSQFIDHYKRTIHDLSEHYLRNCRPPGGLGQAQKDLTKAIQDHLYDKNFNPQEYKSRLEALLRQVEARPEGMERVLKAIRVFLNLLSIGRLGPSSAPVLVP